MAGSDIDLVGLGDAGAIGAASAVGAVLECTLVIVATVGGF